MSSFTESGKSAASSSNDKNVSINGSINENSSNWEIPATDSDESSDKDVIQIRRKSLAPRRNHFQSSDDESTDEEEQLRKTFYEEHGDEDDEEPIEEQAYSRATRQSINGYRPRKSVVPAGTDSGEESDVIIVEELEAEDLVEQAAPDYSIVGDSGDEASAMLLSLREETSESPDNLNNANILFDEAVGGMELTKVSPSQYREINSKKDRAEMQVSQMIKLLEHANSLPDRGEKIQTRIQILCNEIEQYKNLLAAWTVDESKSTKSAIIKSFQSESNSTSAMSIKEKDESIEIEPSSHLHTKPPIIAPTFKVDDVKPKFFGKVGMQNFLDQKAATEEKLIDLRDVIESRPAETELEAPPKHLKKELMKHQLHALKFMEWREKQKPCGGILADDMGLGKTLTTISLIMKSIQREEEGEESEEESDEEEDDGWKARGRKELQDGGTLVIAPATVFKQWGQEITSMTKRGALKHNLFHGPDREFKAHKLAKHDVVITTYMTVVSELKNNGVLFQVKWKRIVLDEGHVIRNHKSKQSEAVCSLPGKFRWFLSGTPIQNKEFDLFAAIKFLKCRPFDDLIYWKTWIEQKKSSSLSSSPRVQTLLKAILLRRTKQQLIESGEIDSLPDKVYRQFDVTLNRQERLVYNKFLTISQSVFASYVAQQQEKNGGNGKVESSRMAKLYKNFTGKFNVDHEVKNHEILTIILRLRQICCHPGLAKDSLTGGEMVEGEVLDGHDDQDESHNESDDLMKQIENMQLEDGGEEADADVFNLDIPSSKLNHMMDVLRENVLDSENKAIIVSQWTSYLSVARGLLELEGVKYCEINGTVPVKNRNDIIVKFNKPDSGIKIMLLSLTAGGVGLNLVGANYLFLMDLHWNPQLEQQAQDRIYRFGQTKQVNVYKFVCKDTIEEHILKIQQKKRDTADSALTGAKIAAGSKLTLDDLKTLFGYDG